MIKLICSDVNGVLEHIDHDYSKSGYYKTKNIDSKFSDKINNVFIQYKYLIKSWMTNEISFKEINKILIQSIKEFEWNWDLINLYQEYRQKGIKVVITTDNMDIFSKIAVSYNDFNKYFDKIYNSADIKLLKEENNYQFFNDISKEYNLKTNEVLIVDDNKRTIEETGKMGYKTYLYNMDTYKDFEKWINKKICVNKIRPYFA